MVDEPESSQVQDAPAADSTPHEKASEAVDVGVATNVADRGMGARLGGALRRWGGVVLGPRRHVRSLAQDEGTRDGLLLGALYVAGTSVYPLAEALAGFLATGSWMPLASGLGRALLAPVLILVVVETLLGSKRSYRAGLCLIPLVVTGTVAHALAQMGVGLGGPPLWPEIAGGLLAAALAWWIRPAVSAEDDAAAPHTPWKPDAATLLGLLPLVGALMVGGVDARYAAAAWDTMGPAPPGTPLENFAVQRLGGGVFDHSDLEGHVSVVTFWATWCHACQGELGDLDELDDTLTADERVQFLAVNWEGVGYTLPQRRRIVAAHQAQTQHELPVAIDDGTMARALRVGAIPHTMVIDRRGVVRHVYPGRVRTSTLRDDVSTLLAENL